MKNRVSLEEWDNYYRNEKKLHIRPKQGFFMPYDIFLCDSILDKHLPFNKEEKERIKICEIGCGDGKLLKKIADNFNYEAFGIEYSKEAIKQAKELGINIIEGDVFDNELLNKYKEYFDVVYSYGFVEHIKPPEIAINVHLTFLKPGGYFFIQIPRFKSFNYWKIKFFRPDLLSLHNLEIMEKDELRRLCNRPNVEELFCGNYGTFKLRVPMKQKNFKFYLLKILGYLENLLSPLFRFLFGQSGFETKLFSPNIMFIGRKR